MTDQTPAHAVAAAPMTDQEYLATGANCCPHCRSEAVSGGSTEVDGSGASQEVGCEACGERWLDVYDLQGWIPA